MNLKTYRKDKVTYMMGKQISDCLEAGVRRDGFQRSMRKVYTMGNVNIHFLGRGDDFMGVFIR